MQIIEQMLNNYQADSIEEKKQAIKEIMQEVVLSGLSRANFFKEAAFYGGTALRIFYGLDRYSEGLDFTLLISNSNFNLDSYIPILKNEVHSLGLEFEIKNKEKSGDSNIQSAFLKGNTKEQFLYFYPKSNDYLKIINNEKIKIKFEIDVNPPRFANTEIKYRLLPYPYQVKVYDMPSLFAGKIHAVLCRTWKDRVKGRDLYDYVFYLSNNTQVNLKHLQDRMIQSKFISNDFILNRDILIKMLNEHFAKINYEAAKQDVLPFIKDINKILLWSETFFVEITKNLIVQE